ncbi:MAG: hypothetical protein LBU91_02625, partial [Bacteroidales bacterium]|nr:hypothetical protein [Bacteroidales bacterium]
MERLDNRHTISDYLKDELRPAEPQEVRLRSEAVQDILGRTPRWMIRWGISVIFGIVLGLFVGSYFFKYPDIVLGTVVVNSEHLPAHIVSPTAGRIDSLFVGDGQRVEAGDFVTLLQNSTDFGDYCRLKDEWRRFDSSAVRLRSLTAPLTDHSTQRPGEGCEVRGVSNRQENPRQIPSTSYPVPRTQLPRTVFSQNLQLGDLQPAYSALLNAYSDYRQFIEQDYHNKKIAALRLQVEKQRRISNQQNRQLQSVQKQIEIAQSTFKTDSTLYAQGVISASEYDEAEQTFLNALQTIENARTATESQAISILQSEQQIYDLERERQLQNNLYQLNFSNAKEQFFSQLHAWEQTYLLQTPISGTVSF